jgi:hypothetical protein
MNSNQQTTSQQQPAPERMTAAELRVAFDHLHADNETIMQVLENQQAQITSLRDALTQISVGLTHAASAGSSEDASRESGDVISFVMDTLTFSTDESGKPTYKAKGGQYSKFGVRVWPEMLSTLGIDPATLKPGPNPINPPIPVCALLGDTGQPKKVTAKA